MTDTYYDCSDNSENLRHESMEEALECYIDKCLSLGCDVAAIIGQICPITVTEFQRSGIPDGEVYRISQMMKNTLLDELNEEYGGPEDPFFDGDEIEILNLLGPIVQRAIEQGRVWNCDRVADHDLNEKKVLELMRSYRPDWFE